MWGIELSQEDLARRMGCTVGRVDKLESAVDADLRLGDLAQYARALGINLTITMTANGWELVENNEKPAAKNSNGASSRIVGTGKKKTGKV